MIIGVTGKNQSGKDHAADYLAAKDMVKLSLSDEIRKELVRRGEEFDRQKLIDTGNELRKEYGAGVLVNRALADYVPTLDYVVPSVRNLGEVAALAQRPDFFLLSVESPVELRWKRMSTSERPDRIHTLLDFMRFDAMEQSADPTKQQLHLVGETADIVIVNDGTVEQFEELLDTSYAALRHYTQAYALYRRA